MEPLEVGLAEGGVLADQIVHGGHSSEGTRGPRRRDGTLNPYGTAAPSFPADGCAVPSAVSEVSAQSGQRASGTSFHPPVRWGEEARCVPRTQGRGPSIVD
ncbi:hypothetical protein GCM10023329_23870 [Streptomyces sanyensis]|uniref:Uncharacterized protein n=1 Tax=Streptomyces sanyensis TaxID=568869 RepID=A0ABP9A6V4_9ACTN